MPSVPRVPPVRVCGGGGGGGDPHRIYFFCGSWAWPAAAEPGAGGTLGPLGSSGASGEMDSANCHMFLGFAKDLLRIY